MELLSGLVRRSAKQLEEVRSDITSGAVQVAIGTHALLSDKIRFKNLGLLASPPPLLLPPFTFPLLCGPLCPCSPAPAPRRTLAARWARHAPAPSPAL